MSNPITKSHLDTFTDYFDCMTLSPSDWPVVVTAAIAAEHTIARWPNFPEAATLAQSRLGHGRGLDPTSALRAALGEMIEIASCCDWGDLDLVRETTKVIGQDGWAPELLNGFSASQQEDREKWNSWLGQLDWVPFRADQNTKIAWIKAQDAITGRKIWVPADAVVIGREQAGNLGAVGIADTNGCAAGQSHEAARFFALCELIERDATGRWWYGQRRGQAINVTDDPLVSKIAGNLFRRRRQLSVLNISSDLGLPTVAAVSGNTDGGCLVAGFGTRPALHEALTCALTELVQMELKILVSREICLQEEEPQGADDLSLSDLPIIEGVSVSCLKKEQDAHEYTSFEEQLEMCLAKLANAGCQIAFIDFSRPEFDVPVARAISPDLCHWKPRFGRPRLLQDDEELPNPKLWRI